MIGALAIGAHLIMVPGGAVNANWSVVSASDPSTITNTMPLQGAVLGLSANGGGFVNSLILSGWGYPSVEGRNLVPARYGQGFQSAARDLAHGQLDNPTQAGTNDLTGARTIVYPDGTALAVAQFATPLFVQLGLYDFMQYTDLVNDGTPGDEDGLQELCGNSLGCEDSELRSELDFVQWTEDRSAHFGATAFQVDTAWDYMRPAGSIIQFDPKINYNRLVQDVSETEPGLQPTGPRDFSVFKNVYAIRLATDFGTLMWRAGGVWHSEAASAHMGNSRFDCDNGIDDPYYRFANGSSPYLGSVQNCGTIENNTMVLALSANPDTLAIGLFFAPDGPLNRLQTYSSSAGWESRHIQSWFGCAYWHVGSGDFVQLSAFEDTAGLRPGEAAAQRAYVLIGTPNTIEAAVAAYNAAGYTGDEP